MLSALEVAHSLPQGLLVTSGDVAIPELNPEMALKHLLSTWNDSAAFGSDSSFFRPALFPWVISEVMLAKLNFSAVALNHFWLYAVVMLQALLTLRLVLRLFPNISFWPALIFAALANVLNPYMLIEMHSSYLSSLISVAAFPGVLAAALTFIEGGSVFVLVELLLWVGFCVGTLNLGILAVELPIFLLTVVAGWFRSYGGAWSFVRPLQLVLIFGGAELFFALPSYHWLHSGGAQLVSQSSGEYSLDTLFATSQFSPLKEAVRLVGQYLFFNTVGGEPFVADGKRYVSIAWLVVASCGLPLLALSAGIFFRSYGKRVLLVLAVTLLALFLGKGVAPPAGGIFEWLFFNFPLFQAFRNSFDKFGWLLALGYALLSAVTLDAMWHANWRRSLKWGTVVLAFVALFLTAYPILQGGLFWPKAFVSIPNYYFQLGKWLDSTSGRSVRIPISPTGFDTHDWGYVGAGILFNVTNAPILSRVFDAGSTANNALDDISQDYTGTVGNKQFAGLLGLYGFRYIIYDPTIDLQFLGDRFSERMLDPVPQSRLTKRFGPLRIYRVKDELVNTEIYSPNQLIVGIQDTKEFADACRVLGSCKNTAFLGAGDLGKFNVPFGRTIIHAVANLAEHGSYWARPPITDSRAVVAPLPSNEPPGVIRFEDFANGTISSESSDFRDALGGLVTLGGHPPVIFTVSDRADADFKTVATRGGVICADKDSAQSRDIDLPLNQLSGRTSVFALRHRGHGVVPSIMLLDPAVPTHQFLLTVSPQDKGTFLRVFHVDRTTRRLTARVTIRSRDGGCLHWSFVVATQAKRLNWHLLGYDSDFHVTPPYFAAYPYVLGDALDRLRTVPRLSHKQASPAEQTAQWNEPALVAFGRRNSPWAIAGRRLSNDAVLFRTINSNAALTADFDRLVPSATYELKLPLHHLYGPPARVVLYSQNSPLGRVAIAERLRNAHLEFRLPANATDVTVTVYSARGAEYTANVIGRPTLSLLSNAAQALNVGRLQRAPTPKRFVARWIDRATIRVTIEGAPRVFALVYNAGFSRDWKLSVPKGITQQHLRVNGFANGWLLKSSGGTVNYDVVMHYQNEDYSHIGAIAGSLLVLFSFSLSLDFRRRRS